MDELRDTVCTAGQRPIVGEVCWVDALPMCAAHAQSDDCGRELVALFNDDPQAIAVLDGLMRIPCPGTPVVDDDPAVELGDDEGRRLLDQMANNGFTRGPLAGGD